MNAGIFFRAASVLLVLFAAGHTAGFRRPADAPDGEAVGRLMKTAPVTVQGSRRSFWSFYVGFGLFVTVFLLFAALLAWQLGGPGVAASAPWAATWGLAACFLLVTVMTWRYFFVVPGVLSTLVTLCLVAGAWLSRS